MNRITLSTTTEGQTRELVRALCGALDISADNANILVNGMCTDIPWLEVFPPGFNAAHQNRVLTFRVEDLEFKFALTLPSAPDGLLVTLEVVVPYVNVQLEAQAAERALLLRTRVLSAMLLSIGSDTVTKTHRDIWRLLNAFTEDPSAARLSAGGKHD